MTDALAGSVWAFITICLLRTVWKVAQTIEPIGSPFQQLLHATVLAWGSLVLCMLVLGMTNCLFPETLAIALIGLALAFEWGRRRITHPTIQPRIEDVPHADVINSPSLPPERVYLWVWGFVSAIWIARLIKYGIGVYPSDFDTLDYHLLVIHGWLQSHSLYAPDCQEWYVPGNNEVMGFWLTGLFSGDFLIGLINLPAVLLLVLGILELARQVGVPTPLRHLLALVVITTGVILRQSLTAKNDTATAALFVTTLAYGFRHVRTGRRVDWLLAAVTFGLLAGVKYYAVGYAVIAGATWTICQFTANGWRAAVRVLLVLGVGGLVFCGYWYIRNVVVASTPFYPKGFSPATDTLAQWRPNGEWSTTLIGNRDPQVFPLLLNAIEKHGSPLFWAAGILLPAALVWLFGGQWLLSQPLSKSERVVRWGLAISTLGACLVWIVTPFTVEIAPGTLKFIRDGYLPVRFGLCFLMLGLIVVGVLIGDCWSRLQAIPLRVAFLVLAMVAFGWHAFSALVPKMTVGATTEVACHAVVVGSVGLLAWRILTWNKSWYSLASGTCVICSITATAIICVSLSRDWHANFTSHYDKEYRDSRFTRVAEHLPPSAKVFAAAYRHYPFAASRRQFIVCREVRLMTETRFRAYLLDHNISYLVDFHQHGDWAGHLKRLRSWVANRSEIFRPVIVEDGFTLYQVDRAALNEWERNASAH